MTSVEGKCKFCGKTLTLKIDDDYISLRESSNLPPELAFKNLMAMAACNRCADYQAARLRLHGKIKKVAMNIFGRKVSKEELPKIREHLTKLVMKYMRHISDHRNQPMPDWDEVIIDDIIAEPGNFSLILANIPKLFAQPTLV